MNPEQPPPSYNDIFKSGPAHASAPPSEDFSAAVNPNQTGWNVQHNPAAQPMMQQPPMAHPAQVAQQTIIVVNHQMHFGPDPMSFFCPHCKQQSLTKLIYKNSMCTHVLAGIFCFILCWWPCACMTYCFDCTKDADHKCTKCDRYVGTYVRSSDRARRF